MEPAATAGMEEEEVVFLNNQTVIDKGQQYVMNTYGRTPVALVKGRGSRVWDAEGKQYLDFMSGIAVCALGHAHPELTAVLREQGEKLWHCSNIYWNVPQVELAEKSAGPQAWIRPSLPTAGRRPTKSHCWPASTSGVRAQPLPDYRFRNSFHGRTTGALALTGQTEVPAGI